MAKKRGMRRKKKGVVISNKMDKTITVKVDRLVQHPLYKKYIRNHSKFKAHDEKNEAQIGDFVEIIEVRPLSKTKHWRLVKVLEHREEFV